MAAIGLKWLYLINYTMFERGRQYVIFYIFGIKEFSLSIEMLCMQCA